MDPRVIFLTLVIIYEVEMVPVLRRHRREGVRTSKCEQESYFDPNIGENGRCQPCEEICNPKWGTQDQCLATENVDQCRGTYMKYHPTTMSTVVQSTLTTESEVEQQSQTIMIVAIATVLLALLMSVLLAICLYKKHGKAIKNCCQSCVHRPHNVKPVTESSPHVSREQICVNVTGPLSSMGQSLLIKYGQEESVSLCHNSVSIV